MKGKLKLAGLIGVLVVGMSAVTIQNDKLFEITKNIEIFVNAYKELNANFVDELDPSELMTIGINAMTNSLDPYTRYISEGKVESYRLNNTEKYLGLSAKLDVIDDAITITEIYENGPAMKAGLKAGDKILAINGQSTDGKSLEDIYAVALGAPGTKMQLSVAPSGSSQKKAIEVTRGAADVKNVPYTGRVADNIGYIQLTTFTEGAYENIKKALKKMKTEGNLDGVILDLRNNGGGLLREAIAICSIFLEKGTEVVSTKCKVKERNKSYKTQRAVIDPEIPLIVMINGRSASASEIVSGVMQDMDRGVLIGQRSFGKGLVQNFKDLGYKARLKLTTSKYFIPSRRCIQAVEYDKNGNPVDIAEERRSKFKTKNGRTVLDGGGVSPDVKLPKKELSEYTQWLKDNHIIFKYVNQYVENKDSIEAPRAYSFSGYTDFESFVKNGGFTYEPNLVKQLSELIADEKNPQTKAQLDQVIKSTDTNHATYLSKYREEIAEEIELAIITRYYYQSGKSKHKLNDDSEIQEAISLLNNSARYKSILQ